MNDNKEQIKQNDNTTVTQVSSAQNDKPYGGRSKGGKSFGKRGGSRGGKFEKVKPEFDQKMLNVRRVTRVVAGGRRFAFSVAVVAGDRKGSVGVGIGKAGDTSLAIDKAMRNAKKNMIKVRTTKDMSIAHQVTAKYSSGKVIIMPTPGKGLVAGSAVRYVLELAGLKDVGAKVLSPSKNKLNIAQAAIKALEKLS